MGLDRAPHKHLLRLDPRTAPQHREVDSSTKSRRIEGNRLLSRHPLSVHQHNNLSSQYITNTQPYMLRLCDREGNGRV